LTEDLEAHKLQKKERFFFQKKNKTIKQQQHEGKSFTLWVAIDILHSPTNNGMSKEENKKKNKKKIIIILKVHHCVWAVASARSKTKSTIFTSKSHLKIENGAIGYLSVLKL
jgi:hypothetical protein